MTTEKTFVTPEEALAHARNARQVEQAERERRDHERAQEDASRTLNSLRLSLHQILGTDPSVPWEVHSRSEAGNRWVIQGPEGILVTNVGTASPSSIALARVHEPCGQLVVPGYQNIMSMNGLLQWMERDDEEWWQLGYHDPRTCTLTEEQREELEDAQAEAWAERNRAIQEEREALAEARLEKLGEILAPYIAPHLADE